jgi:hypothetical protein
MRPTAVSNWPVSVRRCSTLQYSTYCTVSSARPVSSARSSLLEARADADQGQSPRHAVQQQRGDSRPYSTAQYSPVQSSPVQSSPVQYNTILYTPVQDVEWRCQTKKAEGENAIRNYFLHNTRTVQSVLLVYYIYITVQYLRTVPCWLAAVPRMRRRRGRAEREIDRLQAGAWDWECMQ